MLSGGGAKIVSDSIDYIDAEFDFRTEDWEGLSKWAHFSKDGMTYDVNLVSDKIAKDAHVNLSEGDWELKLHGTDPEGTMRITTDTVVLRVESYGSTEEGGILPEVSLSAAEQIDAKAQEALLLAMEVKEKADAGEFAGPAGPAGPQGEQGVQGEQGIQGERGIGISTIVTSEDPEDLGHNYLYIHLDDGRFFGWTVRNGSKGDKGEPGLVWRGEWNAEEAYGSIKNGQFSRDVVSYNGSSYVLAVNSTVPVIGVVPEGDTTGKWELLAKKANSEGGSENLVGDTESITPTEVANAVKENKNCFITHTDATYGRMIFSNFAYALDAYMVVASVVIEFYGMLLSAHLVGDISTGTWSFSATRLAAQEDIPEEKVLRAVDLSGFQSEGEIVETYTDGSSLTYNFEFDSEGNPTKITDSDGNETVLTW